MVSSAASASPRPRRGLIIIAVAVLAALVAVAAYTTAIAYGAFELSAQRLEARYRLPNSRFMKIGAIDYHYVVEGAGPPLVLIHPPYLSLRAWDHTAAQLGARHRVIRFDMAGAGLTRMQQENGYTLDTMADDLKVMLDRLGVERAAVVGSSSGALVGLHLALRHPAHVERLVMISPSGMPRNAATDPNRARGSAIQAWIERHYRSKGFWRDALMMSFTSTTPSEALLEQVYDMNRKRNRTAEYYAHRANYQSGDRQADYGKVRAPTLILWGMANPFFNQLEGDVIEHWLTAAPSLLIKYPDLGLYPWLEAPGLVEGDIEAFVSGRLDDRLRRTMRVPA